MATPDNKNQAGTEKPAPSGSNLEKSENLGETTRSKAQEVLTADPNTPPPNEPEAKKPPTREQLIDQLGLRDQYENRADHMVHLINQGVFKLGKPIPTLEATLNSFTTEQLELASTLKEPTLLLVPETSFAAKVLAIDAYKTIKGQKDTNATGIFTRSDSGSGKIAGWKAMIVDGAAKVALKDGDDVTLLLRDRIANRKSARRPGEKGMDHHTYAMLMLEALQKSEPTDQDCFTLLDDDPALSDSGVPYARWYGDQVFFRAFVPGYVHGDARLRSSVGGDVEL